MLEKARPIAEYISEQICEVLYAPDVLSCLPHTRVPDSGNCDWRKEGHGVAEHHNREPMTSKKGREKPYIFSDLPLYFTFPLFWFWRSTSSFVNVRPAFLPLLAAAEAPIAFAVCSEPLK